MVAYRVVGMLALALAPPDILALELQTPRKDEVGRESDTRGVSAAEEHGAARGG